MFTIEPPEVRGRIHRLKDGRIGRFGWKAQVASLDDFVLTACANELGLEVPGHHQAASPLAPEARARGLDLTAEECAALVDYVGSLPPPVSLGSAEADGPAVIDQGRELFQSIGCASCHTPDLGPVRGIYSDLLLHDMGDELADAGGYYQDGRDSPGAPTSREWRTPPLWGVRDSGPYLHDGRARSLAQAVALHRRGQGAASAHQFHLLGPGQQSRLLAFLNSLAAPGAAPAPERSGRPAAPGDRARSRACDHPGAAAAAVTTSTIRAAPARSRATPSARMIVGADGLARDDGWAWNG